jgi:hypothetical protein
MYIVLGKGCIVMFMLRGTRCGDICIAVRGRNDITLRGFGTSGFYISKWGEVWTGPGGGARAIRRGYLSNPCADPGIPGLRSAGIICGNLGRRPGAPLDEAYR